MRDQIFKTSTEMKDGAMTLEAVSSPGKFLMYTQGNKHSTLKIHRPYDETDIPYMLFELKLNDDQSGITIKSTVAEGR